MRTCLLLHELGRSGGVAVAVRHAAQLARRPGSEVAIVLTGETPPSATEAGSVPVISLAEACEREWDMALATWWTTADRLWDLDARRRAVFLQSLDLRYYRDDELPDRVGAAAVLALPVDYLAVGEHMRALLARLRPDARCAVVPNAVDKAVFAAAEPRTEPGPLRVLVEGQPTLWFKGVDEAIAAVRAMREPATVTLVAQDPAGAGDRGADRVVGGLDAAGMRDLYAEHDVLLKLSRFEGFGLPVLEAFHVGRPCVVAPYAGHDELVRHGENGLVVGFDDTGGTAAALDALASDAQLRDRLGRGALATAASWPDAAAAGEAFAAALEAFAAEPAPAPETAMRSLARLRRLGAELVRAVDETHEWERVRQHEAYVSELEDRERRIAEVDGWLRLANERLEAVQSSRAYRLALLGRRAMFWRGRGG